MRNILPVIIILTLTPAFASELVLPQLACGPDWSTRIIISSYESEPVDIILRFYRPDGTEWNNALLRDNRQRFFGTDPSGKMTLRMDQQWTLELELERREKLQTGFVVVDTNNKKILISAFHCYFKDGCRWPTASIGLAAKRPIQYPAGMTVSRDSAIAIANAKNEPVALELFLELSDNQLGRISYQKRIVLDGFQQMSFFVIPEIAGEELLPDRGVVGRLTILSNDSFSAMGVLFPENGVFSSVPIQDMREHFKPFKPPIDIPDPNRSYPWY